MRRRAFVLAIPAAFAALTIPLTSAGGGVTFGPPELEYLIRPGEALVQTAFVRNNTGAPLQWQAEIRDWDGVNDAPAMTLPTSAFTWMSVSPERFTVGPGESQTLRVTVSAPPDASGGRFARVLLRPPDADVDPLGKLTMRVGLVLGINVPIRVLGTGRPSVALESARWEDNGITLTVRNDGDVHVRPSFRGVLMKDGGIVATLSARDVRLLPGLTRTLHAPVDVDAAPGVYELVGALALEPGLELPVATPLAISR